MHNGAGKGNTQFSREIPRQSVRKETVLMEKANRSIHCTVTSCTNHCKSEDYCSLDSIQVGSHECNPTMDQCTDCQSFAKKN